MFYSGLSRSEASPEKRLVPYSPQGAKLPSVFYTGLSSSSAASTQSSQRASGHSSLTSTPNPQPQRAVSHKPSPLSNKPSAISAGSPLPSRLTSPAPAPAPAKDAGRRPLQNKQGSEQQQQQPEGEEGDWEDGDDLLPARKKGRVAASASSNAHSVPHVASKASSAHVHPADESAPLVFEPPPHGAREHSRDELLAFVNSYWLRRT